MEALIFAGVIASGYFFNKSKDNQKIITNSYSNKLLENSKPNGLNIYQSNKVNEIKEKELQKSKILYDLSKTPSLTGIIPPYFNSLYNKLDEGVPFIGDSDTTLHAVDFNKYTKDNASPILDNVFINPNSKQSSVLENVARRINVIPSKESFISIQDRPMFKSTAPIENKNVLSELPQYPDFTDSPDTTINPLTGLPFDKNHHNTVPFFGSHVKESLNNTSRLSLEKFTGTDSNYIHKTEVNINGINGAENTYGTPVITSTTAADSSRYIPSRFRQNEKPVAEEYISYDYQGTIDDNFRPQYRTNDELYINPKQTYKGVLKIGNYEKTRSTLPNFYKKTPDLIYTDSIDRSHLKSNVTKGLFDNDYTTNLKNPQRENQSTDYQGNVGQSQLYNTTQRLTYCDSGFDSFGLPKSCVSLPFKSENKNNYTGNLSKIGEYNNLDTERKSIQLPNTQRITTNYERAGEYNGRKTGTMRLQDEPKITLKETLLDTDHSGFIKSQHDFNLSEATNRGINNMDAKTTLKEDLGIVENRYTSQASKDLGLGYITNKMNAKMTLKEITTENSNYTGNPNSQDSFANESRNQFDTLVVKSNRNDTLKRKYISGPQKFNQVNDKKSTYINDIRLSNSKLVNDRQDNRKNLNISYPVGSYRQEETDTRNRNKEKTNVNNRVENGFLLDQINSNPYNNSIS
jgi:hypothetical protein